MSSDDMLDAIHTVDVGHRKEAKAREYQEARIAHQGLEHELAVVQARNGNVTEVLIRLSLSEKRLADARRALAFTGSIRAQRSVASKILDLLAGKADKVVGLHAIHKAITTSRCDPGDACDVTIEAVKKELSRQVSLGRVKRVAEAMYQYSSE